MNYSLQREAAELDSQVQPFFFNCFCICRLGTSQDKGARRTLTFGLLLTVVSLFLQVRNVRSAEDSLLAAFALSEPKTIHGTFSTIENTCWWCEVKSFSAVWGRAGRSDTSLRRWKRLHFISHQKVRQTMCSFFVPLLLL